MAREEDKACAIPCTADVIEQKRCPCVNIGRTLDRDATIGSVTVNFHYCSTEERNELIDYLENKCWDFEEDSIFTTPLDEKT